MEEPIRVPWSLSFPCPAHQWGNWGCPCRDRGSAPTRLPAWLPLLSQPCSAPRTWERAPAARRVPPGCLADGGAAEPRGGAPRSRELPATFSLQAAKHFAEGSFIQAQFKIAFIQKKKKIAFSHLHIVQTVWRGSCRSPTCSPPVPLPPALALPDGDNAASAVSAAAEGVDVGAVRGTAPAPAPHCSPPRGSLQPEANPVQPRPPRPGTWGRGRCPRRGGGAGCRVPSFLPVASVPYSWCNSANCLLPLGLCTAGVISFFVVCFPLRSPRFRVCEHHKALRPRPGPTLPRSIPLLLLPLPHGTATSQAAESHRQHPLPIRVGCQRGPQAPHPAARPAELSTTLAGCSSPHEATQQRSFASVPARSDAAQSGGCCPKPAAGSSSQTLRRARATRYWGGRGTAPSCPGTGAEWGPGSCAYLSEQGSPQEQLPKHLPTSISCGFAKEKHENPQRHLRWGPPRGPAARPQAKRGRRGISGHAGGFCGFVGIKRMGPDSAQWCPATGQGAMGTNWSRGSSS